MRRADRHDRETFVAALLAAVPTATRADAMRLLRWGRTYGRLAEAECNGDYPCDNGERKVVPCSKCEAGYVRSAMVRDYTLPRPNGPEWIPLICGACRAERIIRETCERMGHATLATPAPPTCEPWVVPHFQGDPRGYTVRLQIAGAPLDAYERPALAVPTS